METIEALGKYEIKRPLGRGAMGTVYEGWDPIIARRVAIKTVKLPDNADPETEEALARFRREAQAAGRLTHPNIVAVFDYGETNDLAYIVMEFVDGPPLKTLLDKQERFALTDTIRVMEDLLAGLQFSHERGVVHRDIKPANVMLTSSGQAKIADFGIARIESSSMTQAGTLLGTPAYMSPEQFMGQVVDARTDIYSSGVLLYQMLTGERPFEGGMSAIMHKALNTEPPAPSQLSVTAPPSFDAVVRRAMAKRPEDRFASASAFAEAMRTALTNPAEPAVSEDEATMVAPSPLPQPHAAATAPPRGVVSGIASAQRSTTPILAAAALLVLGVVGGGWWFFARQPVPPPVIGNTIVPPPQVADATPTRPPVVVTPPVDVPSQAPIQSEPNQSGPTTAATSPPQPPTVAPQLPPPVAQPAPAPVVQAPPLQSPPPPVTQPNDQQLAMVGLEVLRRQIAQWVSGRTCALLDGDVKDNRSVTLNGLAGHGSVDDLRQGLSSFVPPGQIDLRVTGVNRVFCPALTALHPISPTFGVSGGPRLGLQMADGKTRLHDGDRVRVRLVMPDFAGRLRVDYIAHDGNVQHLYPQLADSKAAIVADPPRTFEPGEPVNLGHPSWQIGEPYGTDMIIAVASSEPLFDRPRPSNAETAEVYLRDLQAAIEALRQRGAHLAGAAVTLEALP
jgi:eukaryotic-like serine/threonine-protein kinase